MRTSLNMINMENILQYTRFAMYGLTIRIILQLVFLAIWLITYGSAEPNIRGLEMVDTPLPNPIPCNTGTIGSNCTCPANCLKYVAETGGCHPIDCWSYSTIKAECNEAGKEWLPAIILQGIPVTGVFGSGFGNIGRWDIFGTYMTIMFGGCLMICCFGCLCGCCVKKEEDKETVTKFGAQCGGCLWSIAITGMWIWGIVTIANKSVDAPWTNYRGEKIMCPLVGN